MIKQIVLDYKKVKKDIENYVWEYGHGKKHVDFIECSINITNYIKKLIKDEMDKIQVVSIDREEVEKIIKKAIKFDDYGNITEVKVEDALDKILSLLKPVKTLSREEVEKILNDLYHDLKEITLGQLGYTQEYYKKRHSLIDKICNLAIKEGDK